MIFISLLKTLQTFKILTIGLLSKITMTWQNYDDWTKKKKDPCTFLIKTCILGTKQIIFIVFSLLMFFNFFIIFHIHIFY